MGRQTRSATSTKGQLKPVLPAGTPGIDALCIQNAWSTAPRPPRPQAPPPAASPLATHPDETPVAPRPLVSVLAIVASSCSLNDTATALPPRDHQYLLTTLDSPPVCSVEHLLDTNPPRLVLLDPRWSETAGIDTIQRLRQQAPGVDWLVCWTRPARQWLPLLLACGARGAITCDATPQSRVKALDGVLAGEIWLPRQVLQWLYAQMLDSSSATARTIDSAARLTPREAEVVALIHQGLSNREVAERLGVSINTVKKHLTAGFEKLGVQKRRQLLG